MTESKSEKSEGSTGPAIGSDSLPPAKTSRGPGSSLTKKIGTFFHKNPKSAADGSMSFQFRCFASTIFLESHSGFLISISCLVKCFVT